MSNDRPEITGVAKPKILLADTNRWGLSARLAISLAHVGCEVMGVCPSPGHALTKTREVRRTFRYSGLHPVDSLAEAITEASPDLVIPSCDRSVGHLHELYRRVAYAEGTGARKTAMLLDRSLGSPASHAVVSSRHDLLAVAAEEGVRVPRMRQIRTAEDLEDWREHEPIPWVIKADGTWGGGGVRIAQSWKQAEQALAQLAGMFRLTRAIKRLAVNRDPFWLRPWWIGVKRDLMVQSFIQGRPANCAVVSWKGQVLAAICVEVASSDGATGPANIVRLVENAEMRSAAEKIASRLHLSGFFGLDFMIEDATGAAYLIEMNPRPTPPCYLRLGEGRDLPGSLWASLTGQPAPAAPATPQSELIAYFPFASRNDPAVLERCYQDIPQNEPELVDELLHPFPDRSLLFRLVNSLSPKPSSSTGFAGTGDLALYEMPSVARPDSPDPAAAAKL
jgi:hypothetical protein